MYLSMKVWKKLKGRCKGNVKTILELTLQQNHVRSCDENLRYATYMYVYPEKSCIILLCFCNHHVFKPYSACTCRTDCGRIPDVMFMGNTRGEG